MHDTSPDPVARAVGAAISAARRRAGLSMRELAGRAQMSQPFLSNLENGRSMPSLSSLYRLAAALGIEANQLLPPMAEGGVTVVRRASGPVTPVDDAPGSVLSRLVFGGPDQPIEVHEYEAGGHQPFGGWFEHAGDDLIYLVDGRLEVSFGNGRVEWLERGDAIHYGGREPHRWRVGDDGATVLLVNVHHG